MFNSVSNAVYYDHNHDEVYVDNDENVGISLLKAILLPLFSFSFSFFFCFVLPLTTPHKRFLK